MLSKDLREVTWEDIEALVNNETPEDKEIDFKRKLPEKAPRDKSGSKERDEENTKSEFLADISAFANAGGGHIIYGISEEKGIARDIVGMDTDIDIDKEILRLQDIIRNGVEPQIHGINMKRVSNLDGKTVVIIHIPMSWSGPHRIKANSRFIVRNSAGKHPMDVSELRAAFSLSESISERIRRFRDDRLGKIMSEETPIPLGSGAKLVLHIVPIASAHRDVELDVEQIADHSRHFYPLGNSGGNFRFNLDGFLMVARGAQSYCQVFRNGRVEGVTANMENDFQGGKGIPSSWCEEQVIEATTRYLVGLDTLGILYPMIIMVSVLGVRGYYMPQPYKENGIPIDRDTLILPDVVLKECPTRNGLPKALRPIFDALLNAGGFSGSSSYDSDGEWRP